MAGVCGTSAWAGTQLWLAWCSSHSCRYCNWVVSANVLFISPAGKLALLPTGVFMHGRVISELHHILYHQPQCIIYTSQQHSANVLMNILNCKHEPSGDHLSLLSAWNLVCWSTDNVETSDLPPELTHRSAQTFRARESTKLKLSMYKRWRRKSTHLLCFTTLLC